MSTQHWASSPVHRLFGIHTSLRDKLFPPLLGHYALDKAALNRPQVGASDCFQKCRLGHSENEKGSFKYCPLPPVTLFPNFREEATKAQDVSQVPGTVISHSGLRPPGQCCFLGLSYSLPMGCMLAKPGPGAPGNHADFGKVLQQEQN